MTDKKNIFLFRLFVYAGLLLVPLVLNLSSYNITYVKDVLFTAAVLGMFVSFAARREIKIKIISLIPLLYVVWALVCTAAGDYPHQGLAASAWLFVLFVFFFSVINCEALSFRDVRNVVILTAVPHAFIGIIQILFPGAMGRLMVFGDDIPGTFGNPNFFAAYIAAVIPVVLWRVLYGLGIRKVLNLLLLVSLAVCLVNTGSKAGVMVFILEAAYFVWFFIRQRGWGRKTAGVLFLVIFAVSAAAGLKIFDVPAAEVLDIKQWQANESVFFRQNTWEGTVKMAADNPLTGAGPGAFSAEYPRYRPAATMKWASEHSYEVAHPENIFLQTAAETGLPGFLMFAFFVMFIIKHLKKEEREELDFYLGFLGLIAINLFSVDLNYISSAMFAVFFAAIVMSDYSSKVFTVKGRVKNIAAGAAAVLLIVIFVSQTKRFVSDVYLSRAVYFSKQSAWSEAAEDYKRALKAYPGNVTAGYFFASSLYDAGGEGSLNRALEQFKKTEKIAPDYVLLHLKKGSIYADLGDVENAEKSFRRMIKLDPYLPAAYLGLARAYYRQQMYAEAESAVREGLVLMPDEPELLNGLGKVFLVSGRFRDAKKILEKAVAIRERKDYYYNLGLTMLYLGEDGAAASYLEKAGALKDKNDPKLQMLINALRINLEGK
ncbi:MAG: O-antigen ligase family protein [Candidatus Goldiibacteriota bacterium]